MELRFNNRNPALDMINTTFDRMDLKGRFSSINSGEGTPEWSVEVEI